jgi:hypothetical protein
MTEEQKRARHRALQQEIDPTMKRIRIDEETGDVAIGTVRQ